MKSSPSCFLALFGSVCRQTPHQGDRIFEIMEFLHSGLWLRCPSEGTLAKVVAVCVAAESGRAMSRFRMHELMEQVRAIWKSLTSKHRLQHGEVPEFLLTLPGSKEDLPEKLKEQLGGHWEDIRACPFASAHDLDNYARCVPLRKTNLAVVPSSQMALMQGMCMNPMAAACAWATNTDAQFGSTPQPYCVSDATQPSTSGGVGVGRHAGSKRSAEHAGPHRARSQRSCREKPRPDSERCLGGGLGGLASAKSLRTHAGSDSGGPFRQPGKRKRMRQGGGGG